MHTTAKELALGGMFTALGVVLLCLGGVVPLALYACPILASAVLLPVRERCRKQVAWSCYAAIALLGTLLGPDKEAAALYAALEQAKLFPPTMLYMIASGEESGELGNLMDRAAENQESALQHRITLTLSVFEPALVVSMATIVLFIVLSILQPLLQLNNMVG